MTPLQRERLNAACAALQAAGARVLHGRLLLAGEAALTTPFDHARWQTFMNVLAQARSWASIRDGVACEEARRTQVRDAIGLLWAVTEEEP